MNIKYRLYEYKWLKENIQELKGNINMDKEDNYNDRAEF